MAWYRCGGGGLPSGLQTDMDAVLNKKFSTSTTYPPTDWPDTVNLMGPLPERTASGSIAHITDGADSVPLKAWEVTVPANLSGVSSLQCTQAGKNLFDKNNPNEIDGYITTTGFSTLNTNAKTVYIPIIGGATYTVSKTAGQRFQLATAELPPDNGVLFTARQANNTASSITITAAANDKYLWAWVFLDGTDTGTLSEMLASVQIEVGSTVSAFEPYTAPTQYTVSLGRTVYGATADVVNGTGSDGYIKITDFSTLTANGTSSTGAYRYKLNYSGLGDYNVGAAVSNSLTYHVAFNGNVGEFYNSTNSLLIFLSEDNAADAIAYLHNNNIAIVAPLTTSTAFTFTPISPTPETPLGVSNYWADEGDSAVTYRADISLALAQNNGGRGLMMMRPTEPEETEETEGLDDELNR